MKAFLKKAAAIALAVLMAASALAPGAFAAKSGTVTATNPAQVLRLGLRSGFGPLTIAKTTLHRGDTEEEVYLIAIGGAQLSLNQMNNYSTFIASALSLPTVCLTMVINAAKATIPEGSKVMLIGHSVGGNIAQQFAAEIGMRKRYEIINTLACGSPVVLTLGREGQLHRLCDLQDPIPQISLATLLNTFLHIGYEWSGMLFKLQNPHGDSYYREDVWGGYDCLGVKGGDAYLTCNYADCVGFSLKLFPGSGA